MADVFTWIRPGYELVTAKFEWNVQVPFLQTKDGLGQLLKSPLFSPQETPNSKWELFLVVMWDETWDENKCWRGEIVISADHCDSTGRGVKFVEPVLGKLSILNNRRQKVFQQMVSSGPMAYCFRFNDLFKKDLVNCQQSDGSLIFSCKILTHVKQETESSAAPPVLAIDGSRGLSTHLDGLFNNMQFSDVNFNISGREFPAHKAILSARSPYFAAMFRHPTKENSTNQVNIEDIEPDVFQELLRFIYTGGVPLEKLETMAASLFITADKYLLGELKLKCENYLLCRMSPDNCVILLVILLLHGDLQNPNPAKYMKKAVKFFRRNPSQVMATDKWEKLKQENPALMCNIHEFVFLEGDHEFVYSLET